MVVGHLAFLFANVYGLYKALTLEFLSTLQVNYGDKELISITFRLQNLVHTLSLAEFDIVFQLLDDGEEGCIDDPAEYNRDDLWGRITLDESTSRRGPTFIPSCGTINSIRTRCYDIWLKPRSASRLPTRILVAYIRKGMPKRRVVKHCFHVFLVMIH